MNLLIVVNLSECCSSFTTVSVQYLNTNSKAAADSTCFTNSNVTNSNDNPFGPGLKRLLMHHLTKKKVFFSTAGIVTVRMLMFRVRIANLSLFFPLPFYVFFFSLPTKTSSHY